MKFDELSRSVIGYAIEVHRNLGPGLLEFIHRFRGFTQIHPRQKSTADSASVQKSALICVICGQSPPAASQR
jgi:hypothetical protein